MRLARVAKTPPGGWVGGEGGYKNAVIKAVDVYSILHRGTKIPIPADIKHNSTSLYYRPVFRVL